MFQPCEGPQWIKGKSTGTAGARSAPRSGSDAAARSCQFASDATIGRGMPQDWLQYRGIQCNSGIFRLVRMGVTRHPSTGLDPVRMRGRR